MNRVNDDQLVDMSKKKNDEPNYDSAYTCNSKQPEICMVASPKNRLLCSDSSLA